MHFHLKINTGALNLFNTDVKVAGEKEDLTWCSNQILVSGQDNHTQLRVIETAGKKAWFAGDPVFEAAKKDEATAYLEKSEFHHLLKHVQGHYRLIVYDKIKQCINIASSLFNILPVYYSEDGGTVYISSEVESLSQQISQSGLNKRFLLENILFNYQLFNETVYKKIKLLPAHHLLEVSEKGMHSAKYFTVSDWYSSSPVSWKKSTNDMAGLFVERVKYYLPDEPCMYALTGGFDSRTLVSCGLYYKKNFETYSFGNKDADDTRIAAAAAAKAGIKFNNVQLDEEYITRNSLNDGLEFILNSNGNGGFARAHYLYACKSLQSKTKYIITGNFGSEIFRAVHNAGAVINNNLYQLFTASNADTAFRAIESSPEFNWLNQTSLKNEWEELKADITALPVFNQQYAQLSQNEKFYLFVFEEVFRKYFGAEMVNQFRYLNNRTPFLDAVFLEALFKTGLPGVYAGFLEKNPLKRYKGQVLYAHILNKTYPAFSHIPTGKGYRPNDLLTVTGKINILVSYFKKKITRQDDRIDPNAVDDAFKYNKPWFQAMDINAGIFNEKRISEAFKSGNAGHDFLITLSQSWYANYILNKGK